MLSPAYKKKYSALFKEILAGHDADAFDEAALPSYTHSTKIMSALFWKRLDIALSLAGNLRNKKVMDFGSGGGVLLKYLHEQSCSITACENRYMSLLQEVCRQFSVPAEFCENVFTLSGAQYDFIFVLDVLEHLDGIDRIAEKLVSLLKPDGEIVLSGPTENILYKIGRKLAGFSGHYHVRNVYDIERVLNDKGMKRKRIKTLYWFAPLFRISIWRKVGHRPC
jgi:2-polyprenyl-3-methyl-5-hydroxy-6-metoxy-1,4-benzoquinol methylase